tara:strand:- start:308 stop:598 length:291 start_codon:yes stop_codon:yes gene_type:complete
METAESFALRLSYIGCNEKIVHAEIEFDRLLALLPAKPAHEPCEVFDGNINEIFIGDGIDVKPKDPVSASAKEGGHNSTLTQICSCEEPCQAWNPR